ncbi:MAG: gfo/Idh/MocA family oxidoreductase, partial [Nocardioidaceae bacterium]|nr:gfo/Idh/MocA family oxidoreductase [Nocardioidaceae bacterium]
GTHVLVEKPIAMNREQAARITERGRGKGVLVLEAMWTRFLPHMVRLREILAAGELGDLRSLIADHGQLLPADPAHRINDPALGGGSLLDLGIYPLSFAHELFGPPTTTLATAVISPRGVDTLTSVVQQFAGGEQAVSHFGSDARGPNRASVIGTTGRVEIDPVWYSRTSFTRYDADDQVVERFESDYEGRGMQFQAREAERLIRAGSIASEVITPEESVAIMGTLDAVREAIGLHYPGLDRP